MIRRPPRSPLFPSPTLFRSPGSRRTRRAAVRVMRALIVDDEPLARGAIRTRLLAETDVVVVGEAVDGPDAVAAIEEHRSEEHTSELQSQSNLVCRLLLEKKK